QNWAHKRKGQSTEFLPDFPIAIEQLAGLIAGAVIDFSDWVDVEPAGLGPALLDPESMRALLLHLLGRLYQPGYGPDTAVPFASVLGDATKMGLLEAVATFKVYGVDVERPIFHLERSMPSIDPMAPVAPDAMGVTVGRAMTRTFRLAIDLVPYEDYWPDPTGHHRYVIHEVTRRLAELRENPDYDPAAIERLTALAEETETKTDKATRSGQPVTYDDEGEPIVRVRERWGDIVDRHGRVLHRNVVVTTAGSEVLRPPTPNPFWHGRWPFVSTPLVRVPLSTVHKALADHAGPVAKAINELFNLMLDGGFAATWGTRQVRPDWLANPEEIADGIPQGYTAVLNNQAPIGAKFLERVDSGEVPQFAAFTMQQLKAAFSASIATPDTGLGRLPPRQVKATEVVQAERASNTLYDFIAGHFELTGLTPVVELAWLTTWQFLDDLTDPELVQVVGVERALALDSLTPAERFVLLAQAATFKVRGLKQVADRARSVQGNLALLSLVGSNPALAAAYDAEFDVRKQLRQIVRGLGIDPAKIAKTPGEGAILDPRLVLAAARSGGDLLGALGGGGMGMAGPAETPGDLELGIGAPNPAGTTGPGGGFEAGPAGSVPQVPELGIG
ncbi:MAG TPA: hypothetical protein VF406_09035, partial [Thermodesulfobacteriota bacterium]